MKYLNSIFALSFFVCSSAVSAAPERAGDFALLDQVGDFHQFSRYGHSEALVLMSQSVSCASSAEALESFKGLKAEWEGKNVAFLLINSAEEDLDVIRQSAQAQKLDLPIFA